MDTGNVWSEQIQGIRTLYASRLLRFDARFDTQYRTLFDIDNARQILEIGCGPGALAGSLCRMYPEAAVTGIDRDRAFVSFAAEHMPHARFLVGDAGALPFPDAAFAVTISHTVCEHVEPVAFFGEQYRVLQEGGVCLVLTTQRSFSVAAPVLALTDTEKRFWEKAEALPDPAENWVGQYRMDARELPEAMERAGFHAVRSGYVTTALTPDDPGTAANTAHAIIDAERYCALEAVESAGRRYPGVFSEEEKAQVRAAITDKFDRRLRQYDSGERVWDTSVTLTQVVRGVK